MELSVKIMLLINNNEIKKLNNILENTKLRLIASKEDKKRLLTSSIPASPIWKNRNFEVVIRCKYSNVFYNFITKIP